MVEKGIKRNGYVTEWGMGVAGSSGDGVNGVVDGSEIGVVGDGLSAGSSGEGLKTYKRRRCTTGSSEMKSLENGKVYGESESRLENKAMKEKLDIVSPNSSCDQSSLPKVNLDAIMNGFDQCSHMHRRNSVLKHMYQSLCKSEGGISGCIRDALACHPENGCACTKAVKENAHIREDRNEWPSPTGCNLNGIGNAAKRHLNVDSKGSCNGLDQLSRRELMRRSFFDVITSESFSQLCNLLDNFEGVKVGGVLDISLIDSRMKEGAYEAPNGLFYFDTQEIWSKLKKVGTEMVTLAESLSNESSNSYWDVVGGAAVSKSCEDGKDKVGSSVSNACEDGKNKLFTREYDTNDKLQTEPVAASNVCTCRRCGNEENGRGILVCDSCEEMFHVSCVEPTLIYTPKSWYCPDCTALGIRSPHENCVVCERLNNPNPSTYGAATLVEFKEDANEFGVLRGGYSCNKCRSEVVKGQKFRECEHSFCPHKYYHVKCLTRKQLQSYGPRWYCPSCLCRTCLSDRDDDKIVLCDSCDLAYHIYCMRPPYQGIPQGKWFCSDCKYKLLRIECARKDYRERTQNDLKKRGEEGKGALGNLKRRRIIRKGPIKKNVPINKEKREEVSGNSGGVDMLLTAAKTLNLEESLGANK